MGFRFVTLANDSGLMARAARAEIARHAQERRRGGELAKLSLVLAWYFVSRLQ